MQILKNNRNKSNDIEIFGNNKDKNAKKSKSITILHKKQKCLDIIQHK